MKELYQHTACELVSRLKNDSVSIADALDALRARIESVNHKINALPTLCFEQAYEHAGRLQSKPVEQRGQLCGLPVSIKDLTPVAGVRTTFGSALFKDFVPTVSDQLVERIQDNGGIVYAKSNTPEFGAGGITFNDVFGLTRSPHNTAYASGGSSGGAAASLASGCAWLSHGSDMAGSLRTPASFCGVSSLRPSPGTIRADSEFLPFQVLGADGPMARNLADLALFADVMRVDGATTMQHAFECAFEAPLSGARIAVSRDLGITDVSDEIAAAFQPVIERLQTQCKYLENVQPDLRGVHDSFDILRSQNFAVGLEQSLASQPTLMKPEVVWNVEHGISMTSAQIRQALRAQGQIIKRAALFMQNYDVLICPATSIGYVDAELRYPGADTGVPIPEYYRWLAIAYATTMTALPIITIPAGKLENGMPFGIQLIGKPWGEAALFKLARHIEALIGRGSDPVEP